MQYIIKINYFDFTIHNFKASYPFIGHMCWDISIRYEVFYDFLIKSYINTK